MVLHFKRRRAIDTRRFKYLPLSDALKCHTTVGAPMPFAERSNRGGGKGERGIDVGGFLG